MAAAPPPKRTRAAPPPQTAHTEAVVDCCICSTAIHADTYACPHCSGVVHARCADEWIDAKSHPTCPLCRAAWPKPRALTIEGTKVLTAAAVQMEFNALCTRSAKRLSDSPNNGVKLLETFIEAERAVLGERLIELIDLERVRCKQMQEIFPGGNGPGVGFFMFVRVSLANLQALRNAVETLGYCFCVFAEAEPTGVTAGVIIVNTKTREQIELSLDLSCSFTSTDIVNEIRSLYPSSMHVNAANEVGIVYVPVGVFLAQPDGAKPRENDQVFTHILEYKPS